MRLTASRIQLARSCRWWGRTDVEIPTQAVSAAAEVGTALHAVAEQEAEDVDELAVDGAFDLVVGGPQDGCDVDRDIDAYLAEQKLRPADRIALEQLVAAWRAWWPGFSAGLTGIETETPFAISTTTGKARVLASTGQRDYSDAAGDEVPGTTDVVAVRGAELVVLDYKTGRGPHRFVDHEEQMRFLGAAAALEHGVHSVRAIVAHVTADGVRLEERVLDSLDIAVVVHELAELVFGVDGVGGIADASPAPGLHCEEDWCPAKAVCPVTRALLVEAKMPLDERRRLPIVGPIRTNDQAYATLVALDLLEEWLEQRRRDVKEYATATPVRAPDGRVYRGRTVRREAPKLEVAGAEEVLVRVLGPDVADQAVKVKRSTSWTAIKEAVRKSRADGRAVNIADMEEHVRAALREAGALKVSEFTSYEWKAESA